MIKYFCDMCGKEICRGANDDYPSGVNLVGLKGEHIHVCDECYQNILQLVEVTKNHKGYTIRVEEEIDAI